MPVYEYYCGDCNGIFELLRSVREASNPQPCPVCDADARRLMPTDFAAFVVREGLPRRIPDTGKYWTSEGLSDRAETGDAHNAAAALQPFAKGFATSEDDDMEEWRQNALYEEEMDARESGRIPDVDAMLAQQSQDYVEKKTNTFLLKKKLKRPSNSELTPRTRTGTHAHSKLAKPRGSTQVD